jgi:antitoxin component YwqK of YwqJK toxin-antitoxin module
MKERIDRHKDGSIKAKGHMKDGELEGYWEWFRLDGSKLRSGHFNRGKQVGEWTTYDATGKVVKSHIFPIELRGRNGPAVRRRLMMCKGPLNRRKKIVGR